MILAIIFSIPANADELDIYLQQGNNYPACVTIVRALRRLSPTIDLGAWVEHLPPLRGISKPKWTSLDPSAHLDVIRAFTISWQKQNKSDLRSDDEIWSEFLPGTEEEIRMGRLFLQSTFLPNVKLGIPSQTLEQRPWTTDITLLRIGRPKRSNGTIGTPYVVVPNGFHTSWAFMAASFASFPNVENDLIEAGRFGIDLLIINGQPWFLVFDSVLGMPYTNDLDKPEGKSGHRIYVSQNCQIGFDLHALKKD